MTERSDEELIAAYLATRDVRCPSCHYNLRGLQATTCPECGEGVALRVVSSSPPGGGYTAGLVGLMFSAVLALLVAIQHLRYWTLLSLLAALVVVLLGRALVRWHAARHTFGALPRHKKQERVALAWIPAVPLIVLLLFF